MTESTVRWDVFVSYASEDSAVTNAVVSALERAGLTCWIAPRDVRPGALYADEIIHSINASRMLVLVLSGHSIASAHVGREIERACSKRRPIISLKIDAAPLTAALEYFLSESQWVDLTADGSAVAFEKLIGAVRRQQTMDPGELAEHRHAPIPPATQPGRDCATIRPPARMGRPVALLLAMLALAVLYLAADRLWTSRQSAGVPPVPAHASSPGVGSIPEKSVAVLPFVDMSEKKDQEYFSDGLTEELIDHLARSSDLKVIARTSSFQFKGRNEDIRSIGQRLRVANLLEGSVRKAGNALRITVQLVRADTGYHLWSETYDRTADDIFKVQDDIAGAVLTALKASLLGATAPRVVHSPSQQAYNLYLRGHAISTRASSRQEYGVAIDYLRQALRADPDYAEAWAVLSATLDVEAEQGFAPRSAVAPEARRAAEHALELDSGLPDAHVAMARHLIAQELDIAGGEIQLRQALSLEPNNAWALGWAGALASVRGHAQDATKILQRAVASDPENPNRYDDLAYAYYYSGQYPEALEAFRKGLELNPAISDRHTFISNVLLAQDDAKSALAEMDRDKDSETEAGCACRVLALDALGRKAEADAAFATFRKHHVNDDAYAIAGIYASRGEIDETFNWLDRAYQQRDIELLTAKVNRLFRGVRADPRFEALLNKLGLMT
jgi:TolB-like protein/cytochrome c-type biogenesis protein CcmH/NrfG